MDDHIINLLNGFGSGEPDDVFLDADGMPTDRFLEALKGNTGASSSSSSSSRRPQPHSASSSSPPRPQSAKPRAPLRAPIAAPSKHNVTANDYLMIRRTDYNAADNPTLGGEYRDVYERSFDDAEAHSHAGGEPREWNQEKDVGDDEEEGEYGYGQYNNPRDRDWRGTRAPGKQGRPGSSGGRGAASGKYKDDWEGHRGGTGPDKAKRKVALSSSSGAAATGRPKVKAKPKASRHVAACLGSAHAYPHKAGNGSSNGTSAPSATTTAAAATGGIEQDDFLWAEDDLGPSGLAAETRSRTLRLRLQGQQNAIRALEAQLGEALDALDGKDRELAAVQARLQVRTTWGDTRA